MRSKSHRRRERRIRAADSDRAVDSTCLVDGALSVASVTLGALRASLSGVESDRLSDEDMRTVFELDGQRCLVKQAGAGSTFLHSLAKDNVTTGSMVVLHGLHSASGALLNGSRGVLEAFVGNGRVGIRMGNRLISVSMSNISGMGVEPPLCKKLEPWKIKVERLRNQIALANNAGEWLFSDPRTVLGPFIDFASSWESYWSDSTARRLDLILWCGHHAVNAEPDCWCYMLPSMLPHGSTTDVSRNDICFMQCGEYPKPLRWVDENGCRRFDEPAPFLYMHEVDSEDKPCEVGCRGCTCYQCHWTRLIPARAGTCHCDGCRSGEECERAESRPAFRGSSALFFMNHAIGCFEHWVVVATFDAWLHVSSVSSESLAEHHVIMESWDPPAVSCWTRAV